MFTCLAIGATMIAVPLMFLQMSVPFARTARLRWHGQPIIQPERLGLFLFFTAINTPLCGLCVWLWHQVLA